MLIDVCTNFERVDDWELKDEDKKIWYDGKLIIIEFDKIFKRDYLNILNTFVIKKDSYVKRLGDDPIKGEKGICHYINYFIKFYDTNNELLLSYYKLKSLIDNKKNKISMRAFIKIIYTVLFSKTLKEKIRRMATDNYYIDLTNKDDRKYSETLEFTNEHAEIMMMISMSMKIMVPILFHYANTYNLNKHSEYLYSFYEMLFDMYSDDIDIYNKLWIYTLAKVNVSYTKNKGVWEPREIFGIDPLIYLDVLLKDKIISETMFKYTFNKNIISFNSVVSEKQLGYFIIEPYAHTLVELSARKDADGLSGLDKLEMNSNKIDESLIILSNINIKKTIKRIKKRSRTKITKDEFSYYKNHHRVHKFQVQLVFYFYAKYFGGYRDLNLVNRKQYFSLLLLLKRRLQAQGAKYLPQILTGNIIGKLNTRTIQNTKFLIKIENSVVYQTLIKDKFSTLDELNKSNLILNLLSTILNTSFVKVDYDNPDELGKIIEINPDVVSDEFLNFINQL